VTVPIAAQENVHCLAADYVKAVATVGPMPFLLLEPDIDDPATVGVVFDGRICDDFDTSNGASGHGFQSERPALANPLPGEC